MRGKKTGGRKKGSLNKTTLSIKEALTQAFDRMGGAESLVTWGNLNQTEFYKLWGRLAPTEITGGEGGPLVVSVRIVREGRRVTAS